MELTLIVTLYGLLTCAAVSVFMWGELVTLGQEAISFTFERRGTGTLVYLAVGFAAAVAFV